LNASKRSRSSLQLRDALGFESFPSPAFLAQRLDVAHRQARTNAPLTNAFGGSARNSFVPLGNSLDTAGELAERRRRRVGTGPTGDETPGLRRTRASGWIPPSTRRE
jgi:hypothetical protein